MSIDITSRGTVQATVMETQIEWDPPLRNGQGCFFSEAIFCEMWPASFPDQLRLKQAEIEAESTRSRCDSKLEKVEQGPTQPKVSRGETQPAQGEHLPKHEARQHYASFHTDLDDEKSTSPEKNKNKKDVARLKKGVMFLRKRVPYPRKSSLSRAQQKKYLELYNKFLNHLPAQPSKQELKDINMFKELQVKVGAEQEEFLAFLEQLSKKFPKDYAWIHPEARQYVEEVLSVARGRLQSYPKWYIGVGEVQLKPPADGVKPVMKLLGTVLDVGPVMKVILPSMHLHGLSVVIVPTDYDKVSQRFPTKQRVVTENKVWNKEVCSQDKNAERLAQKYGADVVLSSSVLKCLVDNQAPGYQHQWELPVTIREHSVQDPVTGEIKNTKTVYIDKPLAPRYLTAREKNVQFYKPALKTFLTHLPTQKLQKLIKEQQFVEGAEKSNQMKGHISKNTNPTLPNNEEEDVFGSTTGIEEVETFGVGSSFKSAFSWPFGTESKRTKSKENIEQKLLEMKQAISSVTSSLKSETVTNIESSEFEASTLRFAEPKQQNQAEVNKQIAGSSSDEALSKVAQPAAISGSNIPASAKNEKPRLLSQSDSSDDDSKLVIDIEDQSSFEKPFRPPLQNTRKIQPCLHQNENISDTIDNAAENCLQGPLSLSDSARQKVNNDEQVTGEVTSVRQTRSRSAVETSFSLTDGSSDFHPTPAKRGRGRPRKGSQQTSCSEESIGPGSEACEDRDGQKQDGDGDAVESALPKRVLRSNTNSVAAIGQVETPQKDVNIVKETDEVTPAVRKRGRPRKNPLPEAEKQTLTDVTTAPAKQTRGAKLEIVNHKDSPADVTVSEAPGNQDHQNQASEGQPAANEPKAKKPKVKKPQGSGVTPLDSILQMQEKMLHKGQATPRVSFPQGPQSQTSGVRTDVPQNSAQHQQLPAKEDVSDYNRPQTQNLVYSLWTFGNLKLLVRSNIHGVMRDEQLGTRKVAVVPKMEYQAMYGAEQTTFSETARMWMTSFLRQNCNIVRARINVFTSEVMTLEELDTSKILYPRCPFSPDNTMPVVYHVLEKLAMLPEGHYLLSHEKGDSSCHIRRSTDPDKKGSYNLHNSHLCTDLTSDHHREDSQWIPVDPNVMLPYYHKKFDRIPATFDPKDMSATQKFNSGQSQPKNKKKKKK
ncbi:little elongation complex subunit 2 isoform X2 [Lingula anatina]|uniref:Little elongation complex subunit 2 isoform X2 n=1 Tax=Lingula anatina TaxID=7574 RepID=A0A1S3IF13_LINAN|nr:little elongation complex subunit 2 isoform X2 [Lingula anatina]|eukprot:XP_013396855.1 little elongation complex subunit 2 isoform X2 [Lingula anatina]